MTKILNLDALETKREKAIILNGKEHVMKTFTVKEYIYHMREAEKLATLPQESLDTLAAGVDATISILLNAFPTVERPELEALNMVQLDAIRELIDTVAEAELDAEQGEAKGETDAA